MELEEAIYTRRSVRIYNDKPIPHELIEKIIDAGCQAPSACNIQGWKVIVIDDPTVMQKILENGAAHFLKKVKQAIVILYDNRSDNDEYQDYIQSASACIENMLLTAHSLSIGACWVNFLPSKRVMRNILNIPLWYEPIALISLGYYDQKLNDRPRKYQLRELISWNIYTGSESKQPKSMKLKVRKLARKVYLKMPPVCKKWAESYLDRKEKKFDN